MMLKYGKMSGNSILAESNVAREKVTEYYNSLSPEDCRSLRNTFFKIGFRFERAYHGIIKFEKSSPADDILLTDQEKEILEILFGGYGNHDIFIGYSFSNRCTNLLEKIARRNELNFNILDLVEEKI
jgi:hypothetical protein